MVHLKVVGGGCGGVAGCGQSGRHGSAWDRKTATEIRDFEAISDGIRGAKFDRLSSIALANSNRVITPQDTSSGPQDSLYSTWERQAAWCL
ncbi:hypothetical protein IG631_16440 [Alternaria alternata]|nr:hypothetical protein IG631_16440 [Alternaria alternata]